MGPLVPPAQAARTEASAERPKMAEAERVIEELRVRA
jgi:hypothetical protein